MAQRELKLTCWGVLLDDGTLGRQWLNAVPLLFTTIDDAHERAGDIGEGRPVRVRVAVTWDDGKARDDKPPTEASAP